MESALIRVTAILRRKDSEIDALKRTVNAECSERVRLLALLQKLQMPGAVGSLPSEGKDGHLVRFTFSTGEFCHQLGGLSQTQATKPEPSCHSLRMVHLKCSPDGERAM